MIQCGVCGDQFTNNKAGQLTNHLKKEHSMTPKDYVIYTEYGGKEPRCECGYCEDMPSFYRGSFRKYATGHQSFEWREINYLKHKGQPLCEECEEPVEFRRGEPLKYCSQSCVGKNAGFSLEKTQDKIKEVVKERYGVNNVSHLDDVRDKISKSHKNREYLPLTEEHKKALTKSSIKMWQNPKIRNKITKGIRIAARTPKMRKQRRANMKAKWEDPIEREKMLENMKNTIKNRMSGLHRRVREYLELDSYGFVPEQVVGRSIVDELNEKDKIIIEINGDYTHANLDKYKEDDIIRFPGKGNFYTAKKKWAYDDKRNKALEELGYTVIVVWESGDWEEALVELQQLLEP